MPVEEGGDVRARLMVRAREVEQSICDPASRCSQALPDSPLRAPRCRDTLPAGARRRWAGPRRWRGPCLHWVATDDQGELSAGEGHRPELPNWPGLVQAVPGNIIPDFPVINKSFNLSYSGNDR